MRQNRHDIFIERGFASLNDILKFRQQERFYSESEIAWILSQILDGFVTLEQNGIVHSDIKPLNIILVEKNINGKTKTFYKISDFGVSYFMGDFNLVSSSEIRGFTQDYVAPEILEARKDKLDSPIKPFLGDVYSLGVMVFEMMGVDPKDVIKIARGVKKVPLVIKKKYPKILKNAFKMVHDVNFRKSFAYFKRKIEKIEGKTDPNEHNLREKILFEKKKNMNNSMNFYVHDYWREEWILENWKKYHIPSLKAEKVIMEESNRFLRNFFDGFVKLKIFKAEEVEKKIKMVIQTDNLIRNSVERKQQGILIEAVELMREALSKCEETFGSFAIKSNGILFMIFCKRKLGKLKSLVKMIVSEKFMSISPIQNMMKMNLFFFDNIKKTKKTLRKN